MHPEPQENSDSDEKGAVNDQDTRRYPSRTQQRTKAVTKRGCASVKYWRSIHNPLAKNNKTSLLVVRPDYLMMLLCAGKSKRRNQQEAGVGPNPLVLH